MRQRQRPHRTARRSVLIDTSAFYALADATDGLHLPAKEIAVRLATERWPGWRSGATMLTASILCGATLRLWARDSRWRSTSAGHGGPTKEPASEVERCQRHEQAATSRARARRRAIQLLTR